MDDVLKTIQIALTGATSLLRKISTGNTRLVPALKKIMEAAMESVYVDLQYDEIYLTFTAGSVLVWC